MSRLAIKVQGKFVSGDRANYIKGMPEWTKTIFDEEYSPFKAFLDNISPECKVTLVVDLDVEDGRFTE